MSQEKTPLSDENINNIIRRLDHVYDAVSELKTKRSEPVRSLLAAAGTILAHDRMSEHADDPETNSTSIQLILIALHELGYELKTMDQERSLQDRAMT